MGEEKKIVTKTTPVYPIQCSYVCENIIVIARESEATLQMGFIFKLSTTIFVIRNENTFAFRKRN